MLLASLDNNRLSEMGCLCLLLAFFLVSHARPIPLLAPNERTAGLVPVQEGFDFLRSIQDEVALVAFIGRARSGKSFTLNHLLGVAPDDPDDERFAVGHTDSPKTLGVQLWDVPLDGADNKTRVIFMDTEGLGVMPAAYDKTMTLFSVMVASHIVYHMSEYVYHDDVLRLYSIVNLVRHYEKRQMQDMPMPALAWTVQKYSLDRDPGGTARTAFDGIFLREKANPTDSPAIAQYNETARVVRSGFPQQSVFLIPPATTNTELFTLLTEIGHDELNPEYVRQMDELRQTLLGSPAKQLHSATRRMTGEELANYAMDLLPSVNEGVDYIGDRVLEAVALRVSFACREQYDLEVDETIHLPMEEDGLKHAHTLLKMRILQQYDDDMIGERRSYTRRVHGATLRDHMDAGLVKLEKDNHALSYDQCMLLVEEIMGRVADNNYDAKTVDVYDRAASAAEEELARRSVGPGRERCASALHKQLRNTRRTLTTTDSTARRTRWTFLLVFMTMALFVAMMTLRAVPVVRDSSLPAIVMAVFWNVLFATVLVSWSMFDHAPVSFETLAALVDGLPGTFVVLRRMWAPAAGTVAVCGVSYWFAMPMAPAKAASLAHSKDGGVVVVSLGNSPTLVHTHDVARRVYELHGCKMPVFVAGTKRCMNISLFRAMSSRICGVLPLSMKESATDLLDTAKKHMTINACGTCDMKWDDSVVIVTLADCRLETGDGYERGTAKLKRAFCKQKVDPLDVSE